MSQPNLKRKWIMQILLYLYVLLILMLLLTVASYTWFSLSRTPRVSDMNMYINSLSGLELSADPAAEEWELQLDFREIEEETAPLRPVTWSEEEQQFFAAAYGIDGRLLDQQSWEPLTDENNANKDNLDGYYIKTTIYARSGQTANVQLSPAVEVDKGINGSGTYVIGTPIWDKQQVVHSNGGQGAENAIRIGFRFTPMDKEGEPKGDRSPLYIYEPNGNTHIDSADGYVETPSIDGTATLVDPTRIFRQSASTWTEAQPVERNVVIKNLGEFEKAPVLFEIRTDQIMRIEIYIWLEGQDEDCTNEITDAQILVNLQFAAEIGAQSGMQPIT